MGVKILLLNWVLSVPLAHVSVAQSFERAHTAPLTANPLSGSNLATGVNAAPGGLPTPVGVGASTGPLTSIARGAPVGGPPSEWMGLWLTHDDDTGEPMAQVRISLKGGHLSGRIDSLLDPRARADERCEKCTDDRRDQPLLGLEIIRTDEWDEPSQRFKNARILDPQNGQEYRLGLTLQDSARTLQVRGYWGVFWRNQRWTRVN
jgi:Uncharacterized protein conserved in bacteria (DUF2147)